MKFNNAKELLEICSDKNLKIQDVMLQREIEIHETEESVIMNRLADTYNVMKKSIQDSITKPSKSLSGLIGGEAKKLYDYTTNNKTVSGHDVLMGAINSMSVLETNSKMGKIVASPTAGSSGILPGALIQAAIKFNIPDHQAIKALLTASAIGYIVTKNATVSGAEGGCQAETGTASAMAAAAIVEMLGGSPKQALSAASFTFKNILGLVCDPIAGLVECPCSKRNALGAANAMISADMALAGISTIIPFDEVVESMYNVGKIMSPTLRETALGGLAVTPTAKLLEKNILK